MRAYETAVCDGHYYFKEGKLCEANEPGTVLLLAPGDLVWASDLEVLRSHLSGDGQGRLNAVVAKYLVNRDAEE